MYSRLWTSINAHFDCENFSDKPINTIKSVFGRCNDERNKYIKFCGNSHLPTNGPIFNRKTRIIWQQKGSERDSERILAFSLSIFGCAYACVYIFIYRSLSLSLSLYTYTSILCIGVKFSQ